MPTVYFVSVAVLLSILCTHTQSTNSSITISPTTTKLEAANTSKTSTAEKTTSFTWKLSEVSLHGLPTTVVSRSVLTTHTILTNMTTPSSTVDKTTTNHTTIIQPTSAYTHGTRATVSTPVISTHPTQSIASPTRPTTNNTILTILSTANISLPALTSPLITVSAMQPITDNPTEVQETKLLLPLFYIIVLACVGATLLIGMITLLLSLLCLRGKKKKRRNRRRRDSERVSLCNLNRTNSSGSSQSSASGHQMSIVNTTDVILRQSPGRNHTDSLSSRGSKLGLWFNKGSLRPLSTHNPGLNCSTFKPNQQLYLPHIQVQVHVNNDFPAPVTPESRVGSYCRLDEEEKKPISLKTAPARPSSTDSVGSIVDKMLASR